MAAAVQAKEDGVERVLIAEKGDIDYIGRHSASVYTRRIRSQRVRRSDRQDRDLLLPGSENSKRRGCRLSDGCDSHRYPPAGKRRCRRVAVPAETGSAGFVLKISSFSRGMEEYFCRAVMLSHRGAGKEAEVSCGFREAGRAGVYTAGSVQYMMNIQNYRPGTTAVILGSGDIGVSHGAAHEVGRHTRAARSGRKGERSSPQLCHA